MLSRLREQNLPLIYFCSAVQQSKNYNLIKNNTYNTIFSCLIRVGDTRHARHHAQHIVVDRVHTHLGRRRARDRGGGEHKLEHRVINAREVACAAWLVLLGAQGEGVHIDARIGGTRVVLEGLDHIEVGTLTLREAVLAVELELRRDARILTPAVHVERRLGEHEGAGIGDTRGRAHDGTRRDTTGKRGVGGTTGGGGGPLARLRNIRRTGHLEEARSRDESGGAARLRRATKGVDRVGERIDGVRVVEGLGAERAVEELAGVEGRAVVNIGIGLDNPDELLAGVVEVQLDLIRGGAHGLVTRELELLEKILVGVLSHLAALIRVEEDIVDIERRGNEGLLVGLGDRLDARRGRKGGHRPQALTKRTEIKVDLDLVVLESNQGEGQAGVAAKPEEEGDVERRLRERVAGGAHLGRARGGSARATDRREGGVRDVGKLRRVTDHLEVTTLLLTRERELVPDVHPVTVLAVNALATDLNLNLGDELLADEVQPAGINTVRARGDHGLVDLRERHLEVGAVAEITVAGDRASNAATEVSLARESLLDRLHGEVRVAAVRHLPESNFGRSREEHILSTVSDQLHKSTTHLFLYIYYH